MIIFYSNNRQFYILKPNTIIAAFQNLIQLSHKTLQFITALCEIENLNKNQLEHVPS